MILNAAMSRKLLFQTDGDHRVRNIRNVHERYQNQVVPISEHSAEQLEMTFQGDSRNDSERD